MSENVIGHGNLLNENQFRNYVKNLIEEHIKKVNKEIDKMWKQIENIRENILIKQNRSLR